jgi:hypothetical protein
MEEIRLKLFTEENNLAKEGEATRGGENCTNQELYNLYSSSNIIRKIKYS